MPNKNNILNNICCNKCKKIFTIDQLEEDLILKNQIEASFHLSKEQQHFKIILEEKLKEINSIANLLKSKIENYSLTQYDHFLNIKNDIYIRRESIIQDIYLANTMEIKKIEAVLQNSKYLLK